MNEIEVRPQVTSRPVGSAMQHGDLAAARVPGTPLATAGAEAHQQLREAGAARGVDRVAPPLTRTALVDGGRTAP